MPQRCNGNNCNDAIPNELRFGSIECAETKFGDWALDLVMVGRTLGDAASDPPITLALSLPTLDFAGPLVAAGFVAKRAERQFQFEAVADLSVPDRTRLFHQLCALPSGAPLFLRLTSGDTVHAVFERVETIGGEPWAVIRFQREAKGAGREFINVNKVARVFFAPGLDIELPEGRIGRNANLRLGLASAFIPDVFALRQLILRPSSDCALVGVIREIAAELSGAELCAVARKGAVEYGTLQDVVRAVNLSHPDEPARSAIFAVKSDGERINQYHPALVIFCGCSAYLNQAAHVPKAHHVVLLCPSERNYEAGVSAINDAFLHKLAEISDDGWPIPEGATATGFQRRVPEAVR